MEFNDLVLTAADDNVEGTSITLRGLSSGKEEFNFYTTSELSFDLYPGRVFRCTINEAPIPNNEKSLAFESFLKSFVAASGNRVAFTFLDATMDQDDVQVDNAVDCELDSTVIDRLMLGRTYIIELTPQN